MLLVCSSGFWPASEAHAIDDPALTYHTITTPHFYVHYYDGLEDLAKKVARTSEEAHLILAPLLKWQPAGRTHVNVFDRIDTANGSANAYGRTIMNIFGMPPEGDSTLGYYDDWIRILVFHEYVHVLHLDTFSGISRYINYVIGKQLRPNQVLPRWYTEGLAVYYESFLTGTGRIHGALYQMWMRAEATRPDPLELGAVTHTPTCWPLGSTAYLYGSFFIDWIAARHGPYFFTQFNHLYGSRLIPYSLNQAATEVGGESFEAMWDLWRAELEAQVEAFVQEIAEQGQTPLELVTIQGGTSKYPRIRPNHGSVTFYHEPLTETPSFSEHHVALTPPTHWPLFRRLVSFGAGSWFPQGRHFLYSERAIKKNVYSYEDLFLWDAQTDTSRRLTRGQRAREPSVSPDGTKVVYVRNAAGTMELVLRRWQDGGFYGPEEVLVSGLSYPWDDDRHWLQVSTPVFAPDGRSVVFSLWRLDLRQRDLWRIELDNQGKHALEPLMRDGAMDLDPSFGPDGRLYFTSDRTGVYNVYAMEMETREVTRLSNLVYGMFNPVVTPDAQWIYGTTYSFRGYDIARIRNPMAQGARQPLWPATNQRFTPWRRYPEIEEESWVTQEYEPLRWSAPLFFTPDVALVAGGVGFGGLLSGVDPVGRQGWTLRATLIENPQFDLLQPNLVGSYAYTGWVADLGLQLGHVGVTNTRGLFAQSQFLPFLERQIYGTASISYPIRWVNQFVSLAASYTLVHSQAWAERPRIFHDPGDLEPRYPEFGMNHRMSLTASYSNVQRFPLSISPEIGYSLFASTFFGGQLPLERGWDFVNVSFGAQGFLPLRFLPWGHALSMSASTGFFANATTFGNAYSVGGFGPDNWLLDLVFQGSSPAQVVRGYPRFALVGDSFVLGSGQWRFPLAPLDEGFSTAPLFFRWLKGSLFMDAGTAYSGYLADADWLVGAGGEVILDTTLGWYFNGQLRLGWARGLVGEQAQQEFYLLYGGGF